MPVKASEIIKTLEVDVTKQGGDGAAQADKLVIKYRPITKGWLDKWGETAAKELAAAQTLVGLVGELGEAKRALELAENGTREGAQKLAEELEAKIREHREQNPEPEYDLLTRQMADLLTDVGYVDEDDKPLPVTCDLLANVVDRELLVEIESRIQKKLLRL